MIEIKNLTKIYQHPHKPCVALEHINLSIAAGEIFGIVGKSGSGKSSLLRCMNFLEKPTHGSVFIDGVPLLATNAAQLKRHRQKIGFVFQHFNLLESRSVFDNIGLPLELMGVDKKQRAQQVNVLLEWVNLTDKAHCYPSALSGGQKQRVAIARALITQPKILLCDEATSALDPESTQAILTLLEQINQKLGITIVLITHEMDVVKKICHQLAVLDRGLLVEQGSVLDIFTAPKTEVVKRLVTHALHLELPAYLTARLHLAPSAGLYPIVRLTFIGQKADQAIVTTLLERFQVAVNILLAHLESIHQTSIGFMLCQLRGNDAAIAQALNFLAQEKIQVEIMGYE
jgi:D-methionine transport system ATP-binding protein